MKRISKDRRAAVVTALIEGNSVNSTSRMCGVNKRTVLRLLNDLGALCLKFHDDTVRGLAPKRIQCDEIWSFVGCKQKTAEAGGAGHGDAWVWVALDSDSKLVLTWHVGLRSGADATAFMLDLAGRVVDVAQLTTDAFRAYPQAVQQAFGDYVDYAQLVKLYRAERPDHARYSPACCIGCKKEVVTGAPDPDHVSTSHVERQNLTMRMRMRRFTRLTNAFSKKLDNHAHNVALHYFHYNFIRRHQTLGTTPAVAAGLMKEALAVADLIAMLERAESEQFCHGRINRGGMK